MTFVSARAQHRKLRKRAQVATLDALRDESADVRERRATASLSLADCDRIVMSLMTDEQNIAQSPLAAEAPRSARSSRSSATLRSETRATTLATVHRRLARSLGTQAALAAKAGQAEPFASLPYESVAQCIDELERVLEAHANGVFLRSTLRKLILQVCCC